jgi:hypothetical protein
MNNILKFVMLFAITPQLTAQFDGAQQIISTEANAVRNLAPADINGDGFIDVVYSSQFDSKVGWFENLNGTGAFGLEQFVGDINQTTFINTADLDNDGDQDVLAISGAQNVVVWFENIDGLGTFAAADNIAVNFSGAFAVAGADVNDDGFIDVVASASNLGAIYWFENVAGSGNFSARKLISNQANDGRYFNLVDIDGDDDIDVVATSSGSEILTWYENLDGQGNFGTPNIIAPAAPAIISLYAADLDGDGDIDIVTPSAGDDEVAWYENLDGLGTFSVKRIIDANANEVRWTFVADLDNDGDNDVLTAGTNFNTNIAWYENLDGDGSFGAIQEIFDLENGSVSTVSAADLDNDGDMDVLSSSFIDDKVAWYENLTILGITSQTLGDITLYPNPAKNILNINAKQSIIQKVSIRNMQGSLVINQNKNTHAIAIDALQSGVYFITIDTVENSFSGKFVKR